VAPLGIANGTLGCRSTPVGNHWLRSRRIPMGFFKVCVTH